MVLAKWPIRVREDFPQSGIKFQDVMPWVMDVEAFRLGVESLQGLLPDCQWIAGIEARGWIIGAVLAERMGVKFLPIRRAGKLPFVEAVTTGHSEYAEFSYEMPELESSFRGSVVVIDDVLATGRTAEAVGGMLSRCGFYVAGYGFFITIEDLRGWEKLGPAHCFSVVRL